MTLAPRPSITELLTGNMRMPPVTVDMSPVVAPTGISDFLKSKPIVKVKAGAEIENHTGMFSHIFEGYVRVYRRTGTRNLNLAWVAPGGFFGHGVINGQNNSAEVAEALTDLILMRWTPEQLRAEIASDGSFREFNALIMARVADLEERIAEREGTIWPTLIRALLRIGRTLGHTIEEPGKLVLPHISHQRIADEIDTSREIVTAHLGQLRLKGAVEYTRKSLALDTVRLRELLAQEGK